MAVALLVILAIAIVWLLKKTQTPARRRRIMRVYYRSRDGLEDYRFEIVQLSSGNFRIFILESPDYCGRDEGCHPTHRLSDAGRKYVCWDGPIRSVQQAKQVAALWADSTQRYIKHGTRF